MSRRKHKGPPRCRDCDAQVEFFLSPHTGRWRTFNPKPVDLRHGYLTERAYPVEGKRAWKYTELVEELMVRLLVENVDVVALTNPSDGRAVYGLELAGKVNQADVRSDVLYLMDADGAAAIVSELVGLFVRAGDDARNAFLERVVKRLDQLPTDGGNP